jgi:hypothetical protein
MVQTTREQRRALGRVYSRVPLGITYRAFRATAQTRNVRAATASGFEWDWRLARLGPWLRPSRRLLAVVRRDPRRSRDR